MQMTTKLGFVARLWYYFRIGYGTYLTFLLGFANTLIVVWYLAIKEIPLIEDFFGHFIPFAVVAVVVGVPLSIGAGWLHLKRTPAYSSEMDIGAEANPYNYKLPPGYNREAYAPLFVQLLSLQTRLLDAQGLLTDQDKSQIKDIEQKMQRLIDGQLVGTPRTNL